MKRFLEEYSNMEVLLVGILTSCRQHNAPSEDVISQFVLYGQGAIFSGLETGNASEVEKQVGEIITLVHQIITSTRLNAVMAIEEGG